ncbi:MAG: PTS sugar transporter subunit IIC [Inconstantimicrobium porci]|uniref:PTS transporter subunit IIC n=1 Tax=Inconstantimicrobium porci TaxID=2652291 RepID=UPI0024097692|nr:PTS sugar transporter subunit IIC [Inconstantimicrobium porci]MDD6771953.1 PTS sugar transporter subunit IIC [Inconstantimicrobium porci]MDY5910872.1 PTS sugar transporter subunit IIC [Inconstantimicrobium porci]
MKNGYIKDRIFKGSSGLAQGIFVTLGIGLLLENIGKMLGFAPLVTVGTVTKMLMAPGIGAGIAFALGANALTIFSAMAASTLGAAAMTITPEVGILIKTGEPIGAVLAGIVATYVGKRISGKTSLDMMIVPLSAVVIGGLFGFYASQFITPILNTVGGAITGATQSNLIVSSIVIAVLWAILLVSPASSVALALALGLNGHASAAALIGCTATFVSFVIMSYKENNMGAILAIGLCTPKVQLPNVTRNLKIMIPTLVASAIAAPIAVAGLNFTAETALAGMGLCSFVAPISILGSQGIKGLGIYIAGGIVIPGIISFIVYIAMKKKGLIKEGDLKMEA